MNDKITIIAAIGVLTGALAGSAGLAGRVQQTRELQSLVVPSMGTTAMPPHVAIVTAALGTFRGLAVDALWIRADQLEEQGEYFEAQTLAEWITNLQPRFEKVWSFQAWNMAYNICVATQVPAERWSWVSRGINLLRTQGIPLNPTAADLYFDLSWLFRHKIGRVGDKEHWYLKARLATDMQEVLGDLTRGKSKEQAIERFGKISMAPETLGELLDARPEVQQVLATLEELAIAPDEDLVRMLGRVLMANASVDATIEGKKALPPGASFELLQLLDRDPSFATGLLEGLVPHLQRKILEDRYGMDVGAMSAVMERYGPLDWRHFLSHAIYWSEQGVEVARSTSNRRNANELLLIRGRLILLMELMRQGRIEVDGISNRVDLLPDPRYCRVYEASLNDAYNMISSEDGVTTVDNYGNAVRADLYEAYERFLNSAVMLTYLYGDQTEARRYFLKLRDLMTERGMADLPLYQGTLKNFVAMRFADQVKVDLADFRQFLDAMLRRAIGEGLGKGDFKVFNRFLGLAFDVYDKRYSASDPATKFTLKDAKLLEFPKLVKNSFDAFFRDGSVSVMERARVWHFAPDNIKSQIYEDLKNDFAKAAKSAGLNPEKAFPAVSPQEEAGVDESVAATDNETQSVNAID